MTVAILTNKSGPYAGTGIQTIFTYGFKIFAESELRVYRRDANGLQTLLTLNIDYSITGVGVENGGTVVLVTPPAAGETVMILGVLPLTQETSYSDGDAFPAEAHESALDRLIKIAQQLDEKSNRAALLPESSPLSGLVLPNPTPGYALGWAASGRALENVAPSTLVSNSDLDHIGNYEAGAAALGIDPLAHAVSIIGAVPKLLLINKATPITTNLAVPATLELWLPPEGRLQVANAVTATIPRLRAGNYQCLELTGSGQVVGLGEARPEWFGANGLGPAIQGLADGGVLRFAGGLLSMTAGIYPVLPGKQRWVCEGPQTVQYTGAAEIPHLVYLDLAGFELTVDGPLFFDGNNKVHYLFRADNACASMAGVPKLHIRRLYGINAYSTDTVTHDCSGGLYIFGGFELVTIEHCGGANINRAAGVSAGNGSQGIAVACNTGVITAYAKRVVIIEPQIDGVISEEPDGGGNNVDCDGISVFGPTAAANGGVKLGTSLEIIGGRYRNCRGRSIKVHNVEQGGIINPVFVRDSGCLRSITNGAEVDWQGGMGSCRGAKCYYGPLAGGSTPFGDSFQIFTGTVYAYSSNGEGILSVEDVEIINNVPTSTDWLPYFMSFTVSGAATWRQLAIRNIRMVGSGGVADILYGNFSKVSKVIVTGLNQRRGVNCLHTNADAGGCVAEVHDNYCDNLMALWAADTGLGPVLENCGYNANIGSVAMVPGEARLIANNASYVFARQRVGIYGPYSLKTNFSRLSCGLFVHDGTALDLTGGASTEIAYGGNSSPDTANKFNVWKDANGCINVKNLRGADAIVSLKAL